MDDSTSAMPERREPNPQNGQCIPFGQMLSYGPNGAPTIVIVKTLFSAGVATSTTPDSTSTALTSGSDAKASTVTETTTGTSTIFNTLIITSTKTVTTSSTPSTSSTALSNTTTTTDTSSKTRTATATATASGKAAPTNQGGTIAGSVIGSMAAFSMIGFLIWYLCIKKQGKKKFKAKIKFRRRKSSDAKTPKLEDQSMEQTRTTMLQKQLELNKSKEKDLNSFLGPNGGQVQSVGVTLSREKSQKAPSIARPSMIGVAVSSSTPPNTPPLPRSNSQKSTRTLASTGQLSPGIPPSLTPGFGSRLHPSSSSLMPAPLKSVMKPAPIITSPQLARPDNVSPLSPRGMFNAVSNGTTKVWRRASQALSPSSYQRLQPDGQGGFETANDKGKTRIPELEIGAQTDKGWNGQWI